MDLTYLAAAAAIGVGFLSGILSTLAGVGGAVLTTPGIRALGASPLVAVGTTVPAVIPSAITGTIRYAKEGLVDWRAGLWCGLTGTVAAFGGAWLSGHVNGGWLMVATAALVLWGAATLLWPHADEAASRDPRPEGPRSVGAAAAAELAPQPGATATRPDSTAAVALLVGVGVAAGFVAGLLGVGGGIILVPAFTLVLRLPVKETIATSLVAVALMSVASLVGHALAGHINWDLAVALTVGVVPGARLGSRITVAASERTMRLACGMIMLAIGATYLALELVRLV